MIREEYYLRVIRSGAIQVGCAVHKPRDIVKEHGAKRVNTKNRYPQWFAPQETGQRSEENIESTVQRIVVPTNRLRL